MKKAIYRSQEASEFVLLLFFLFCLIERRAGLLTEHQPEPTEAKVQNLLSLLIMRSVSLHLYLLLMLNPAPGNQYPENGKWQEMCNRQDPT